MIDSAKRFFEIDVALKKASEPYATLQQRIDKFMMPEVRLAQNLFADPLQHFSREVSNLRRITELQSQWKLLAGPLQNPERLRFLDLSPELRRNLDISLRVHEQFKNFFRLPEATEVTRLASQMSALTATILSHRVKIDNTFIGSMGAVKTPWLNTNDISASVQAFAKIHSMGRMINQYPPYAHSVSTALRKNLGDWRYIGDFPRDIFQDPLARSSFYIKRGFQAPLTNFPAPAFDEIAMVAGLSSPSELNEPREKDEQQGFERNKSAYALLLHLETELRRWIDELMTAVFGKNWPKHQTDLHASWTEKREAAKKVGETTKDLISYADFTDYLKIIERRDNWEKVFRPVFRRKDDVKESFMRLFPIRICTMHARIITLDDELLLHSEAKRILRVIKSVH